MMANAGAGVAGAGFSRLAVAVSAPVPAGPGVHRLPPEIMAGSPLLLTLMRLLWQSFPQEPQVARPRDESVADHKQLIEALRDRDAARAQAITQQHILGAIGDLEDE